MGPTNKHARRISFSAPRMPVFTHWQTFLFCIFLLNQAGRKTLQVRISRQWLRRGWEHCAGSWTRMNDSFLIVRRNTVSRVFSPFS